LKFGEQFLIYVILQIPAVVYAVCMHMIGVVVLAV